MAAGSTDPPTAPTIRQERRPAAGSLADQIKQQKRLIFEMFQRGDSRVAIKKERDRLRFLQRQQEGGADGAVAESAVREFLAAVERPPTARVERGASRAARGSTAKVIRVSQGQRRAELQKLDGLIDQEKKLIYRLFERGEDREVIKSRRDRLRSLERQREEMGAAVAEAHEQVTTAAHRRHRPRRLPRVLAASIPFMLLAVVAQSLRFRPELHVVAPWYGFLAVVGLGTGILAFLWWRFHHGAVMGVVFPFCMIVVNAICVTPLGLLGEPDWSLALGFIVWLLLGLGLAFTDRD